MLYNRTSNGSIFQCDSCSMIHLEFNNLNINFSTKEKYQEFAAYVHEINVSNSLHRNQHLPYERKIVIPIGGGGCNFVLHPGELEDLRRLCIRTLAQNIVRIPELNIDYSLN